MVKLMQDWEVGERTARRQEGDAPPVLWHLKVSHYNEKARWALDYKGIAHERRAVTPGEHRKIARRLSGGQTLPVLELDGEAIGDSTQIIAALERLHPEPALYPSDPAERRRALEVEEFFDEELGPHLRLLVIHHMLPDPKLLFGAFAPDLGGARRRVARSTYPLLRRGIVRTFEIDDATVERAWAKCRAACGRFTSELQINGHLVGEGFTVADLTVAALCSPVVAPPEFPYPQPQRHHPRLADLYAMLEEAGAAAWTRETYARHRPRSCEVAVPH